MSRERMENVDGNVKSASAAVAVLSSDDNAESMPNTNAKSEADALAISTKAFSMVNELKKESSAMSKPSNMSRPSIMCRICHTSEECERLLSPCKCKGTTAFVHQQCLEYWLSRSGLSHCELCLFHFATANHLRYGMWESMRIWFSHPSHRALLQADLLLCMLLSIITFGLVAFSMFGMYLTTTHNLPQNHVTRYWTETSIGVFLGIVVFAFILNTVVVVKANIIPWFRWWRRSREIQLVIRDNNVNQSV